MKRLFFGDVEVQVHPNHIRTQFRDGAISKFFPPVEQPDFQLCARMFGYTNSMQYGLEHDTAHSWLAHAKGLPHSEVVWAEAHGRKDLPAQVYDDEEHLVNRMLRYLNTGQVDDDYKVLEGTFGKRLPSVAQTLWKVLRVDGYSGFN